MTMARQPVRRAVINGCVMLALGLVGCGKLGVTPNAATPPRLINSLGMQFVRIPAGEFAMGSPESDPNPVSPQSAPQHRVRITRPFYMAVHEVTQADYRRLMKERAMYPVPPFFSEEGGGHRLVQGMETDQLPVDNVSWNLADEFCRRLSELPAEVAAGRTYRLPTEAEWEYACRAGSGTRFAFGDRLSLDAANINGLQEDERLPLARLAEVGSYAPNAFGIYDMHGNVWEWCQDSAREYSDVAQNNPVGPSGVYRVLRGGAWDLPAAYGRSDFRQEALMGYVFAGIRLVCELSQPPATSH